MNEQLLFAQTVGKLPLHNDSSRCIEFYRGSIIQKVSGNVYKLFKGKNSHTLVHVSKKSLRSFGTEAPQKQDAFASGD